MRLRVFLLLIVSFASGLFLANEAAAQKYPSKLDDAWISANALRVGGFRIFRRCSKENEDNVGQCTLTIRRGKKILWTAEVEPDQPDWLKYGLFRFIPGRRKQLVVHTYSGGAHCCYDYHIFDLSSSQLRTLYDSSRYNSATQIGNALTPVDIDKDGTYEFYQDVMAFDYWGFAGHASATFPPAIFAFDSGTQKFVFANRRFHAYVIRLMKQNLAQLKAWQEENNDRNAGTPSTITDDETNEVVVREKFLYLVYAGREHDAWPYFKANYKTANGDGYQDQFRDKFIREFKQTFVADPTYRSIYRSTRRKTKG